MIPTTLERLSIIPSLCFYIWAARYPEWYVFYFCTPNNLICVVRLCDDALRFPNNLSPGGLSLFVVQPVASFSGTIKGNDIC
jgi:hypothetical protein